MTTYAIVPSDLGDLLITAGDRGLTRVAFPDASGVHDIDAEWSHDPVALREPMEQLVAYLRGELRRFDLPLTPTGTAFQRQVWDALGSIGYGRTVAYVHIAARIGRPTAVRAVAQAIGRNPLGIVVPCHRVIGADGTLTGYASGLDRKRALLELEGVSVP